MPPRKRKSGDGPGSQPPRIKSQRVDDEAVSVPVPGYDLFHKWWPRAQLTAFFTHFC